MPKKLEECVKKVKSKGNGAKNPYAICNASIKKKSKKRGK